jgi:peptidoglycan/LPS O-acetylase OafA/YrhL
MVDVFFVISGYVLSVKLLKLIRAQDADRLLQHFTSSIFRRYMRLFLLSILISFISMLLVKQFWRNEWTSITRFDTFSEQFLDWLLETFRFANPFACITGFWTADSSMFENKYDTPLWTIPVEVRPAYHTHITAFLTFRSLLEAWFCFAFV